MRLRQRTRVDTPLPTRPQMVPQKAEQRMAHRRMRLRPRTKVHTHLHTTGKMVPQKAQQPVVQM